MENSFRKIDIDVYDDDLLTEQDLYDQDTRSGDQIFNETQSKINQARSFLTKGDISSALRLLLADPPYGTLKSSSTAGEEELLERSKSMTLNQIIETLSSTKTSEIINILRSFEKNGNGNGNDHMVLLDNLMKFLYKAMSSLSDQNNYSVLLNWHEKLTEVAGTGCIVRVMTDRKRI